MKKTITILTLHFITFGAQASIFEVNDSLPTFKPTVIEQNHFVMVSFGVAIPTNSTFKKDPNFTAFDNGSNHPYYDGKVAGKSGWTIELGGLLIKPTTKTTKIQLGLKYGMSFTLLRMDWDEMITKKSGYSIIQQAARYTDKEDKARNFNVTSIKVGPSVTYKISNTLLLDAFFNVAISRIRGGAFYISEFASAGAPSFDYDSFTSQIYANNVKVNFTPHIGVNLRMFDNFSFGMEFSGGLKDKQTYSYSQNLDNNTPYVYYSTFNPNMKSKINLANLSLKMAVVF